jgi:very-short-patch-repair endonuclease
MMFEPIAGYRLAVEYNGAHWHEGKEASDWRKCEKLVGSGFAIDVVRIREDPLERISESDVLVRSAWD